jgi:hypothetical protein
MPLKKEISKSQKSEVLASTHGNVKTAVQFEGKTVTVGLNVYVPR